MTRIIVSLMIPRRKYVSAIIANKRVHAHSVHPPFLLGRGGGVEPPIKLSKKEGALTESQFLEGGLLGKKS